MENDLFWRDAGFPANTVTKIHKNHDSGAH